MKIRPPSNKETVVVDRSDSGAVKDLTPDILKTPESDAVKTRLLQAALANSGKITPPNDPTTPSAVAARPDPVPLKDDHITQLEGSTAISRESLSEEVVARASQNLDLDWVRQDLPSRQVPYMGKTDEIFLKTFDVPGLSRVHSAMRNNNFTLLVDALNNFIASDLRDITPEDFNFCMYWWRLNSYTRTPYTIPWTSKYGNQNEHRITNTNLEITELKMTRKEYEFWQNKGLCFPTVRDMEMLQSNLLPEEDKWQIEFAQYVYVETQPIATYVDRKLAALKAGGIAMVEDIKEFSQLLTHGVKETVQVVDEHFKPEKAVKFMREAVADSRRLIAAILQENNDASLDMGLIGMSQRADALEEEADLIQKCIDEGVAYQPKKETITLSINAMAFFP